MTRNEKSFIFELLIELVKANNNEVNIDTMIVFGEDILRYLECEEDEEHETSQCLIRIKELFHGHVAKA